MPWISRNQAGQINGVFGVEQYPGQEFLPDDDPEVVAFLNANQPPIGPQPSAAITDEALFKALESLQIHYGPDLRSLLAPTLEGRDTNADQTS